MKLVSRYSLSVVFCLTLMNGGDSIVQGQTNKPKASNAAAMSEVELIPQGLPLADKEQEKREAQTVGMLLLGLIVFLGACSIFFAIFWGFRMRRLVRKSKSSPTQLDDFWYLRKPKEQVTTSRLKENSPADDEPPHPEE